LKYQPIDVDQSSVLISVCLLLLGQTACSSSW